MFVNYLGPRQPILVCRHGTAAARRLLLVLLPMLLLLPVLLLLLPVLLLLLVLLPLVLLVLLE